MIVGQWGGGGGGGGGVQDHIDWLATGSLENFTSIKMNVEYTSDCPCRQCMYAGVLST